MFVSSKIIALVGSFALVAGSAAANASEFQSNGRTAEVRHGDLDLSSEAGQKQLRQRIASAASKVCIDRDLAMAQACKAKATEHVKGSINAAIARAETGERYADAGVATVKPVVGN